MLLLFYLTGYLTFAQVAQNRQPSKEVVHQCYTDELIRHMEASDPSVRKRLDKMDDNLGKAVEQFLEKSGNNGQPKSSGANLIIPVVVYVVHQNGPENISDLQVTSQIDALNNYYDNYGIQFCLATTKGTTPLQNITTPTGITSATAGIYHYYSPTLTNHNVSQQAALTAISSVLPSEKYLRIWVVKGITSNTLPPGSKILGYSMLPEFAASATDGIVMSYDAFGDIATCGCTNLAPYSQLGRILVHEAGHYLGLYHTFQDGCMGMTPSTCLFQGDRVCDTPPVAAPNSGCPGAGWNTCNESPNLPDDINNYMDYVHESCMSGFTQGQNDRMLAAIALYRSELVSSANLVYTGVNCTGGLLADFTASNYTPCTGASVTFTAVTMPGVTYTWDFGDGTTGTGNPISHTYTSVYSPATVVLTVSDGVNSVSGTQLVFAEACPPILSDQGNWYFSTYGGLNFAGGAPVYSNGSYVNSNYIDEASAVQSDASGNLLFYTNGVRVWRNNHSQINSGNLLLGNTSSRSGAVIVPDPANANQYYIFTKPSTNTMNDVGMDGFRYSKVQVTGGIASMTSSVNVPIAPPPGMGYDLGNNGTLVGGEGIAAAYSCNGYWIFTSGKKGNSNYIVVYSLTTSGLAYHSEFQTSIIGNQFTIDVAPNGTKLAVASGSAYYPTPGPVISGLAVYDLNIFNGTLSNELVLNQRRIFGLSFSPDSRLLYSDGWNNDRKLFQHDLTDPSPAASEIEVADINTTCEIQRGPDNKLYMTRIGSQYMQVIHKPNVRSSVSNPNACYHTFNGPQMQANLSYGGLPNMIDANQLSVFNNTITATQISCLTYQFSPGICSNTFQWNFGDPASGTSNTSSLANPVHVFSGPGTYTVTVTGNGTTVTTTVQIGLDAEIYGANTVCPSTNNLSNFSSNLQPGQTAVWTVTGGGIAGLNNQSNVDVIWTSLPGTVTLTITDPATGCVSVETITVIENCGQACPCELNPAFKFAIDEFCNVSFKAASGGPTCLQNVTYHWDFGDGTTGTGNLTTHVFPGPGVYVVCLEVTATNGTEVCTKKICKEIFIPCGPQGCPCDLNPNFQYNVAVGCSLQFFGVSGGPACLNTVYNWDFGDGTTGSGPNPSHVFPGPGVYTVCLEVIATNSNGERCVEKICKEIFVDCEVQPCPCQLSPSFQYNVTADCNFQFFGASGGPSCLSTVYSWDFGDGTTGMGQNPTHTFPGPGVYVVCLEVIATSPTGEQCREKICKEIVVNCETQPCPCDLSPNFQYNVTANCSYQFFGVSGGPACLNVTYNWNFGDGTTGTGQNPAHVFPGPGVYLVCLEVTATTPTGEQCRKQICKEITVTCGTQPCPCDLNPSFQYNIASGCSLQFFGASGGPACLNVTYNWNFGDGTTGIGPNPVHVFPGPGAYVVCLEVIATTPTGEQCRKEICQDIMVDCEIQPCPCQLSPDFQYNVSEDCVFQFFGVSGGPSCLSVTYNWDFGDGTTGTGQNPSHVFPGPGVYVVCLEVIGTTPTGEQCHKKICREVVVNCGTDPCPCDLKPSFQYNVTADCVYQFFGASGGPSCLNVTYNWDFGDGTTGTGQNPAHVFPGPGVYLVCLEVIATSPTGEQCREKICKEIYVNCGQPCPCELQPDFSYSINADCSISFSGISGGPSCLQNVTYDWNFGDGTTGSGQYPSHTFPGPGVYNVCLIVTAVNANGEECRKEICREVEVNCDPPYCPCELQPDFQYIISQSCDVYFEGFSGGPSCLQILSYNWDFGDGSTGTGQTPMHTYAGPGVYLVCLEVTAMNNSGQICKEKICKEIYIDCHVDPCPCDLQPDFSFSINADCSVSFQGISGGPQCLNVTYNWNFGDGTTGTGQYPVHTFPGPGIYVVCLEVTAIAPNGEMCEKKICREIYIDCHTDPCPCELKPDFKYAIDEQCNVYFEGASGGPACLQIVSYEWDFGDGTTGTGQYPVHVFPGPGTYYVCLTVTAINANGEECRERFCREIQIDCEQPPCPCELKPEFTFTIDAACNVHFVGESGGPACLQNVTYSWNFGDGTTGSGQLPTHTFPGPGVYTVCLEVIATNASGEVCREKICKEVYIQCEAPPCNCELKPEFKYTIDSQCNVYFEAASGGPACLQNVTYTWDFGDGTTGSGQFPVHVFPGPGVYHVCVYVTAYVNGQVCEDKYCEDIVIQCEAPPCPCDLEPKFEYTIDEQCNVHFQGHSGAPACLQNVTYKWDFGDGTTGSGQNPVHVFPGPGVYYVCLIVEGNNGTEVCKEKYCEYVEVHCETPPCPCELKPEFNYTIDELCNVHFEGISGGPACLQILSYNWDFGDGTTATGPNPVHVFPGPGVYTVCMEVTAVNANGEECREKVCMDVVVQCEAPPCECRLNPDFTYGIDFAQCLVKFKGFSGGPACLQNVNYHWSFGDGTTSIGQEVGHIYTNPGVYYVCLVVTATTPDGHVCEEKYCEYITVDCAGSCECKLEPQIFYQNNACEYTFTGVSGSNCVNITSYAWYVNGSGPYYGQTMTQVLSPTQGYQICLVVEGYTDQGECKKEVCEYIFNTDCYYNKGREAGYDVELYPNPASEEVNIRFTEAVSGDIQIILRSMEGKQLAVFRYAQASAGRELKVQLPAGISESLILAEIIAGENRVVKKIVILKK